MAVDSLPIGGNELGLKNTQQGFGYALIASGCLAGLCLLVRFVFSNEAPIEVLDWCLISVLCLFAVRRIYVGCTAVLAVLVDVVGPAHIVEYSRTLRELLLHRRIWTYRQPKGLLGQIYYRISPRFVFLTPPYRTLVDGLASHLFWLVIGIGLATYLGPAGAAFFGVAMLALIARVISIWQATASIPDREPEIATFERPERLTEAGNPVDLFNQLRVSFESWRKGRFQNRVLENRAPQVGFNAQSSSFTADLIVETQPMPETAGKTPPSARTLCIAGLVFEGAACGILLFCPVLADTVQTAVPLLLAGALAGYHGSSFLQMAQRICYTFRFHSDVAWLHFEGTCVLNKVGAGGGFLGMPATEGHNIKSDIHAFIRGAHIVSECSPDGTSQWGRIAGTVHPAQRTLQQSPRDLVSATTDQPFNDRLFQILRESLDYRDDAGNLRTPDLGTQGLQGLLTANIQLNQLMNAAAAQGTIQGQQVALGAAPSGQIPALPTSTPSQTGSSRGGSGLLRPPAPPKKRTPQNTTSATPPAASQQPKTTSFPPAAADHTTTAWIGNTITWTCTKCHKQLNASPALVGRRMICSGCGDRQQVPKPVP